MPTLPCAICGHPVRFIGTPAALAVCRKHVRPPSKPCPGCGATGRIPHDPRCQGQPVRIATDRPS